MNISKFPPMPAFPNLPSFGGAGSPEEDALIQLRGELKRTAMSKDHQWRNAWSKQPLKKTPQKDDK